MTYAEYRDQTQGKRIKHNRSGRELSRIEAFFHLTEKKIKNIIEGLDTEYSYIDLKHWKDGIFTASKRESLESIYAK